MSDNMVTEKVREMAEDLIKKAKPGDMIEFVRSIAYSHWAIYIGD